MKTVEKVAVSLPAKTLRRLESARKRLGKSRSRAVSEAIECWLDAQAVGAGDRRYVQAYLEHPESADERAAIAGAAMSGWERWE